MPTTSSRMLALLSLLQSRRDWPGTVLADRLHVTTRTIRRDVDRLRELGYAITSAKGPDGGYRLAAGADVPPLLFDDDQAVAIAVALRGAASSGVDIDEAAARALATIRQVMPDRLRRRIDGLRFDEPEAPIGQVDPATLEAVSAAVTGHRVLTFEYAGAAPAASDRAPALRRVEPHAVVARGRRWYLVAWDRDAADWRILRLDRVTPKFSPGPAFSPRPLPDDDATALVAARFKGSFSGSEWPCVGELLLPLAPAEVAPWLGDGEMEHADGLGTRVRVGSWSWPALIAWVLRFDVPFTVVGPPELREALPGLAERVASAGR
jgi:predicted DNA-binding transcriptional regulator YafY